MNGSRRFHFSHPSRFADLHSIPVAKAGDAQARGDPAFLMLALFSPPLTELRPCITKNGNAHARNEKDRRILDGKMRRPPFNKRSVQVCKARAAK
jgi:hypothetical protein